jgi:hypothetical protein
MSRIPSQKIQEALKEYEHVRAIQEHVHDLLFSDLIYMLCTDQELESKILNYVKQTGKSNYIPIVQFLSHDVQVKLQNVDKSRSSQLTEGTFTGYYLNMTTIPDKKCYIAWQPHL